MTGPVPDAADTIATPAPASEIHSARLADRATSPWLLGPWYDTLLISNLGWPLLIWLQGSEGFTGRDGVQFWQVYFLTTPHRWITLGLVFLDRERLHQRAGLFVAMAATATLACLSLRLTTGTLLCLLTVDYLWNAWHFASQHHGIYRIYARRSATFPTSAQIIDSPSNDATSGEFEKWTMRLLLLYVIVRVAGATWRYVELERVLSLTDWLAWFAAAWLLVRDLWLLPPSQPRRLYLFSVLALYASLLAAVHWSQPALVLSLATASAAFHATEYLALVTWSVQQRHAALGQRLGVLAYFAPRWGIALAVFMLLLGAGGWVLQESFLEPWLLLNVIIAFLHYAYDGILWRRRNA